MSAAIAESILTKEKLPIPRGFIPLPDVKPSFDLTGQMRDVKKPSPRRPDAKFAVHIPYLKPRSFRVELNNLESDFKKGDIRWSSVLHQGQGKGSIKCKADQVIVEQILRAQKGGTKFMDDVRQELGGADLSAVGLQESYCLNGSSERLSPTQALATMKELIDRHFPEETHSFEIDNTDRKIPIEKDAIPFRIVAGLYACDGFVSSLDGC
jgi:hypothetical protein